MKNHLLAIVTLVIACNAQATEETYLIQAGDSLAGILRAKNFGDSYQELLPFIRQTIQLNAQQIGGNADFIVPGEQIVLPDNPHKPEPGPIPEPEPKPEPEPEPQPEPVSLPEPVEQPVATITVSRGTSDVIRNDQKTIVVEQGDLYLNDQIVTGNDTRVSISFLDDTAMTLGSNSHFVIDEFSFRESSDSLVATLHQGVLRIITGLIGKNRTNKFNVRSVFNATIGIRGTDFTVRSCVDQNSCGELFGASTAVMDGGISFKNNTSEIVLNKNEFAQIKNELDAPVKAPLPEGFFDLDKEITELEVRDSWWEKVLDWMKRVL